MLNEIHPWSTDEVRSKKNLNSKPKYSFKELSDEEENFGNLFGLVFVGLVVLCCSFISSKISQSVIRRLKTFQ